MPLTVFKYDLKIGPNNIEMPAGAKPLSVAFQDSPFGQGLKLWALVDPDNPKDIHRIAVVSTGFTMDGFIIREFIGTVEHKSGTVWHVFHLE